MNPVCSIFVMAVYCVALFFYLSGSVHWFVGYRSAFRHVSAHDLGCSGASFLVGVSFLAGLAGASSPFFGVCFYWGLVSIMCLVFVYAGFAGRVHECRVSFTGFAAWG